MFSFITEIQAISFEISRFPAVSIFFHLVFVISVHFDLAQVVLVFFLPNHHHPRKEQVKNLEIPLSRKDVHY